MLAYKGSFEFVELLIDSLTVRKKFKFTKNFISTMSACWFIVFGLQNYNINGGIDAFV